MTPQEQRDLIGTRAWYTECQTRLNQIISAMQTNAFSIRGTDAWINAEVNGVPTRTQVRDDVLFIHAGENDDGTAIFEWRAPIGWVM